MTDNEFTIFVRSLLNEEEAKARFWQAADLEAYKKVGITMVQAEFWNLLYPIKKTWDLKDVTAASRTVDLPAGCFKLGRVEYAETGDKVPYISEEKFFVYSRLTPGTGVVAWAWQDGKIYVFPQITINLTSYLRIIYMTRATSLADLPDELHPLVAIETVIAGREKDQKVSQSLEIKRQRYFQIAQNSLAITQLQDNEGNTEVGPDEETWEYY